MNIAVITTFPNNSWDIYSKQMLESFVKYWPEEIPLLIELDDDLLLDQVKAITRPQDAIAIGWDKEHKEFVERNKHKDDPTNYRKQAVRFCHKVFAIKRALDAALAGAGKVNKEEVSRYLVWMDADVITNKPVNMDMLNECLPKEGDAVSYMGRKDLDHSECGWLAFDLENGGEKIIEVLCKIYISDKLFDFTQWHDSYAFDQVFNNIGEPKNKVTNLTPNAVGMDVWPQSPMGKWSTHFKGPQAKANLYNRKPEPVTNNKTSNIVIQTRNAIPDESIRANIERNQFLIKNWIKPCKLHDEAIAVVSAGPMLIAEDLRNDVEAGIKVVAVKHALTPLKRAGIKPWACILLDPRPHVLDFVQDADPEVMWFVASQVNPQVTLELLARGCDVWGYHANVSAGEESLINKQKQSIVGGGSATATRGLFLLSHLGFKNMRLYGYDLCVPDKPDLDAKDDRGQYKHFEISIGMNDPLYNVKRMFWSEPQFIAQYEEINDVIKSKRFNIEAFGEGIVPFMVKANKIANLRRKEISDKIAGPNPPDYRELLRCS